MNFIKCTTDCKLSIIDIPDNDFKAIADSIGADLFQLVRVHSKTLQEEDMIMVVDEEGLIKTGNKCNPVGSILYGTLEHDHPIVGDILFARIDRESPERDFADIPTADAERIITAMQGAINALIDSGLADRMRKKYENSKPEPPKVMSFDSFEEYMNAAMGMRGAESRA
jgi:hypothetical protein